MESKGGPDTFGLIKKLMKVTYYTLLLITISLSSLYSQELRLESPIAINDNGENAQPACLFNLSTIKKPANFQNSNNLQLTKLETVLGLYYIILVH